MILKQSKSKDFIWTIQGILIPFQNTNWGHDDLNNMLNVTIRPPVKKSSDMDCKGLICILTHYFYQNLIGIILSQGCN